MLHDLQWALNTTHLTTAQERVSGGFCGKDGGAAVPQLVEHPITFNHDDHPDRVIAPGVCLLIIDPIIVNTRLSKVLMDGGSSLNIIYHETLDLLGIERAQLQPSAGGFHGVVPGKKALPLG